MIYYAEIPGSSWGSSTSTADEALQIARSNYRDRFRPAKTPHYVLAFPDAAEIRPGPWGGWGSTHHPLALVIARNLTPAVREELEGQVAKGAELRAQPQDDIDDLPCTCGLPVADPGHQAQHQRVLEESQS